MGKQFDALIIKIGRIARKLGLFSKINFSVIRRINGRKVRIPIIKEIGFTNIYSEPWMVDVLKGVLLGRKGQFIDVGANIGQTLIKLKCIDPLKEYIGLEPNPSCVFYLKELIRVNKFTACTILPVGLFDRNGLMYLDSYNESEADIASSLIRDFRPKNKIIHGQYVPVMEFENISAIINIDDIGVIKIDVEGAELEAIKSLYKVISQHRPILIMEILPVYSAENEDRKRRQDQIERIFIELNYSIYRIRKTNNDIFDGVQEIRSIGIHSDLNNCDYIFIPVEEKEKILAMIVPKG